MEKDGKPENNRFWDGRTPCEYVRLEPVRQYTDAEGRTVTVYPPGFAFGVGKRCSALPRRGRGSGGRGISTES